MKLGHSGQRDNDRQRILLKLLLMLLLGLALISHSRYIYPQTAQGRTWVIEPGIAIDGTYTDNIDLAPEGAEEDEFVTQLDLFVTASADTARQKTDIAYRMQHLVYRDDRDLNETFHQLDARSTLEARRESIFIDASATVSQQIIDPERTIAFSNVTVTDNRTDVETAQISPYWRQEIGTAAQTLLRYTRGIVRYSEDEEGDLLEDSDENSVQFSIGSIGQERRFSWLLDYVNERIEFEDDREDEFKRASLELGYQATPTVGLIALAGDEDNDFERAPTTSEPDDSFWEVGIGWQPTRRNQLEIRYGERFFGRTSSLDWQFQGRILTTEFSFTEDITTAGQVQLDTTITPGDDVVIDVPRFRDEVFVSERFNGTVTVNLPKSALSFNVFTERREFQTSLEEDRVRGLGTSWQWQVAPRTSASVDLTFQRNEFDVNDPFGVDDQEDDLSQLRIGVERQIGPTTTGAVELVYRRQDADDPADEYRENVLTLGFTKVF
jgi:hypothetical protein